MIKVLIVDDDNLVRKGLRSMLPWKEYGMEVAGEAKNGEKALEFLAAHRIDLLLTDLAMPVMSGMELMRIVRGQYPHIAIVVLTLHQDFEYIQDCLRLGAIDYIAKVELETDNYDEVMGRIQGRIREEQAKHPVQEGPPPREDLLPELKQHALALGWVHKSAEFDRLLDNLKQAALPPGRLMALLNSILPDWNRVYSSVTKQQIELPEHFGGWAQVEAWLQGVREAFISAIGKPQYSEEVKECVMRAVQAMHEELAGSVIASEMAKRVNMSRSYFSQCFKDLMGMTFNEYLRSIRMDKAKEYLQYTHKSVQWISEHTGYTDQKYFSRVFFGKTGMLPSEYRQFAQAGAQMSGN